MNNPLVQPDPGLYIWTIVTFLVLRGGCWRSSPGGRCSRRSSARQEAIRKSLDDAQTGEAGAGAAARRVGSASWRRRAPRPRRSSSRTRDRTPNRFREEMKQKARAEAAGIVKNAEQQIELETARALQQIRHGSGRHLGGDRVEAARSATCRRKTTSG